MKLIASLVFTASVLSCAPLWAADDVLIADFEGETYGAWQVEGLAFGPGPARGTLPNQMQVGGFEGKGLVNSFFNGDGTTGKLISPTFTIQRKFINFLIGGGMNATQTFMQLIVDGKAVRNATGPNDRPGGSENLSWASWDVGEFIGKTSRIEIVDQATGGWGHINLDQITQSDVSREEKPRERIIRASERWLHLPVKTGSTMRNVTVSVDGKIVRRFDIELADGDPDFWVPLDIKPWWSKKLTIGVNKLAATSRGLEQIKQSHQRIPSSALYSENLRPQFHFSAQRGWLNDPNGLVFYNGEYHLFFQHNPYGWAWGNMHWGHATSRDLVHWQEHGEALYPDDMGTMFSGSAVVDWKNTSGFGKNGKPPLVLIYTAAGNPTTQCIAYSTDGRTFTKYIGNPVIKQITGGNRDPKVFWHEPTQKWIMVLYVELEKKHTVHFFTSPNLREWTLASITEGIPGTNYLFECPDFFELPVDDNPNNKKWVLTSANSEYAIGTFDGIKFTPEVSKLPGMHGRGYYAPQTFSDEPTGRRIQIGWFQTATPGMPFNQSMGVPVELKLRTTPDGVRLASMPVKELETLRIKDSNKAGARWRGETLKELPENVVTGSGGRGAMRQANKLLELRAEFVPGQAKEITFTVRGVDIVFDLPRQDIIVNGHRTFAPLIAGKQNLVVYADRTGLEVFARDGITFVPMPINLKPDEDGWTVRAKGGNVMFRYLDVYELKSIWRNTFVQTYTK